MMKDKICAITGASSGIGREAALELAGRGASVVMICRNRPLAEKVRAKIIRETDNANVELLIGDLSSQGDIRRIAAEYRARFPRLHVLINNAAIMLARRMVTEDGFEMQFAVNHLGYFLLTDLLLDIMRESVPARIVNVSSGMHMTAELDFDNLQGEKKYKGMKQYATTKLLNVLFTYELARRLEGTGITVNVLSPGFTSTDLGWDFSSLFGAAMKLFGKNVKKGTRIVTYLATSSEVEGMTGKYFCNSGERTSSPLSYDEDLAAKIWRLSEDAVRSGEAGRNV